MFAKWLRAKANGFSISSFFLKMIPSTRLFSYLKVKMGYLFFLFRFEKAIFWFRFNKIGFVIQGLWIHATFQI